MRARCFLGLALVACGGRSEVDAFLVSSAPGGKVGIANGGSPTSGGAAGKGGAPSGGAAARGGATGAGGASTVTDAAACSSMCDAIYGACPVPGGSKVDCSAGCRSRLDTLAADCHLLERSSMACVEQFLSVPGANCRTAAAVITTNCRASLAMAAACRNR